MESLDPIQNTCAPSSVKLPWGLLPASCSETPQLTRMAAPLYASLYTGGIEAGFTNVFSMTYGTGKPVGYPLSPTIKRTAVEASYTSDRSPEAVAALFDHSSFSADISLFDGIVECASLASVPVGRDRASRTRAGRSRRSRRAPGRPGARMAVTGGVSHCFRPLSVAWPNTAFAELKTMLCSLPEGAIVA